VPQTAPRLGPARGAGFSSTDRVGFRPLARVRRPLAGKTILVVEDDFLVGHDLRAFLEDAGAAVIGPIGDVVHACDVARGQEIDGAVLDVRLWNETAAPVAVELTTRDVPFIVVSAYSPDDIPPAMRGATYMAKPVRRLELVDVASAMFA
jgi:DNA-binding response OmpR family regulator